MPTDTSALPDLLVIQGEARRGVVIDPAVAADTAAGLWLFVMRAEADSKLSTSTDEVVPTDTAVPPDFLVRKGEARRRLVTGTNRSELSQTEEDLLALEKVGLKVKYKSPRHEKPVEDFTAAAVGLDSLENCTAGLEGSSMQMPTTSSAEGAVPTDTAAPPDFLARQGKARKGLEFWPSSGRRHSC